MKKKVAILVRDRKHEALRMAVGATLANDEVNVFVMDSVLEPDEEIDINIQMLSDLDVPVYSNNSMNSFKHKTNEEIARMLPAYDIVIPY